MHNPRAEAARANGCDRDTFLRLMQEDDVIDAQLTDHGRSDAIQVGSDASIRKKLEDVNLVISSPLSRTLQTSELVLPSSSQEVEVDGEKRNPVKVVKRICLETFREINGWLINAKRRDVEELQSLYQHWDFSYMESNQDVQWTEELEEEASCGERGYQGLLFAALSRDENVILVVSHGGLLMFSLVHHPCIRLECGRMKADNSVDADTPLRSVEARFSNCEIREYEMSCSDNGVEGGRPIITLREVTDFSSN